MAFGERERGRGVSNQNRMFVDVGYGIFNFFVSNNSGIYKYKILL